MNLLFDIGKQFQYPVIVTTAKQPGFRWPTCRTSSLSTSSLCYIISTKQSPPKNPSNVHIPVHKNVSIPANILSYSTLLCLLTLGFQKRV